MRAQEGEVEELEDRGGVEVVEAEEGEGGAGEEDEGLVEGEVGGVEGFVGAVRVEGRGIVSGRSEKDMR